MNYDPKNPYKKDRDRFVLSKGHAAPALYAVLSELGMIEEDELWKLRRLEGKLQGHPSMETLGVEICTGSLGQGFSASVGMALGYKLDKLNNYIYVLLGDGECQEGIIWEAAMAASHYNLDNLCVILDNNNLQIDGPVDEVMSIYPTVEKWKAFGWHVIEINGHDFREIKEALDEADTVKYKPTMVIAKTVKGKGVSFMENRVEWHGKALPPDLLKEALKELGEVTEGGEHGES